MTNGFLSQRDADTLHEARVILERLSDAAAHDSWDARSMDAQHLGRFIEACSAAEDSIFRALNVAASYLSDPIANETHRRWLDRDKSEVTA